MKLKPGLGLFHTIWLGIRSGLFSSSRGLHWAAKD